MTAESEKDLQMLKAVGRVVALTLQEMAAALCPGITTEELDEVGAGVLKLHGAQSAPILEYEFPGHTCISINDEAAHGIPGNRVIRDGDMVNIDVSAELNGYFADMGATFTVGSADPLKKQLCQCSKNALCKAIAAARAGKTLGHIGRQIHREANRWGFTVIKNLGGHGIGRRLHEDPPYVLNYYDPGYDGILHSGLVLAVETFISTGAERAYCQDDGWTLKTPDGSLVAQFEHTIVVTQGRPVVLTQL